MAAIKIQYVCINVKSNKTRYAHMQKEAHKAGLSLTFFNAITPDKIDTVPHRYHPLWAKLWWRRALIPSEIACGLSHLQIGTNERKLKYDHNNIFYIIIFKLLRTYTSSRKKIATILLRIKRP